MGKSLLKWNFVTIPVTFRPETLELLLQLQLPLLCWVNLSAISSEKAPCEKFCFGIAPVPHIRNDGEIGTKGPSSQNLLLLN